MSNPVEGPEREGKILTFADWVTAILFIFCAIFGGIADFYGWALIEKGMYFFCGGLFAHFYPFPEMWIKEIRHD